MRKKSVIIGVMLMFVLMMMAACGGSSETSEDLPQGETETSAEASADTPAEADANSGEVQLLETGYSLTEDNYIKYAFTIENTSGNTAFEFPDIIVTAYDENGDVLATEDQTLNRIQPGEIQSFASIMDCNGTEPDKVEFDVDTGDAQAPAADAIKSSDIEISGTNERVDSLDDTVVTGKLKNNSASDTDSIAVTVLFKKEGEIVCGSTTFVDNVGAGKEKPFEVTEYGVPNHDSYEVSALDWGF